MKKSLTKRKKFVAFGLVACMFVTSAGLNMCEAVTEKNDETPKSSWIVNGAVKGTVKWSLIFGLLLLARKTLSCNINAFANVSFRNGDKCYNWTSSCNGNECVSHVNYECSGD